MISFNPIGQAGAASASNATAIPGVQVLKRILDVLDLRLSVLPPDRNDVESTSGFKFLPSQVNARETAQFGLFARLHADFRREHAQPVTALYLHEHAEVILALADDIDFAAAASPVAGQYPVSVELHVARGHALAARTEFTITARREPEQEPERHPNRIHEPHGMFCDGLDTVRFPLRPGGALEWDNPCAGQIRI